MEWTREKEIQLLETTKEYLETLTDKELWDMGVDCGYWRKEDTDKVFPKDQKSGDE